VTRPTPARPVASTLVRRGLLLVAAATALTAVLAGLARLGVVVGWGPGYGPAHGPLFVLGTFGTVIGLERAVALGRGWGFAAPAAAAVACVAMLAELRWAPAAAAVAAVALAVVNAAIVARQAAVFTWLMLLAALVLVVGSVRWAMDWPVFQVVPAWIGFFVLTIAAERLELSRLAPTPRWARHLLVVVAIAVAITSCAGLVGGRAAQPALGVALALLAGWQLSFDLARRTVRRPGLPRFAAAGVLAGAAWLLASGAYLAGVPLPPAGPTYDAVVHGVMVGYVLSMVFAHAPIILPAVARVAVPFHPGLYLALAALHLGLVARVAGDLTGHATLRQVGAVGNGVALALFVIAVVAARAWSGRAAA